VLAVAFDVLPLADAPSDAPRVEVDGTEVAIEVTKAARQ